MARIAGVDLKPKLQFKYALSAVYGIGPAQAVKIAQKLDIDPTTRMSEISDMKVLQVKDLVENEYKVEGELRQEIFRNIKRLKDIRSYRGDRHKKSLPARGQRTRRNARTKKGKKGLAVGGLKRVLTKT